MIKGHSAVLFQKRVDPQLNSVSDPAIRSPTQLGCGNVGAISQTGVEGEAKDCE